MGLDDALFGLHGKALELRSQRLSLLASNIANAATPGYKARDIDFEAALRDANVKFTRRFHHVEARAREDGVALADAGLERLDGYWNEIRAKERG